MLPVLLEKKRKMQMCHAKMRVPRYAKGRNLLQGLANQATTLGLNKGVSKQLLRCTAGISLPAAASCLTIFLQPKDRKKSFSAFSDLPRRHASKTGWKFSMQKRVEDKTRQKPISLPSKDLGDLWTFVFSSLLDLIVLNRRLYRSRIPFFGVVTSARVSKWSLILTAS